MRPSEGNITLWPIAVLTVTVILLLLSFDLPMRLQTQAPQQFRAVAVGFENKPNPEIADEYWNLTVSVVQWKYPYGSWLPQNPPSEFKLPVLSSAAKKGGEAARQQYWSKLRELWPRPEIWRRQLEFDVSWVGRAVHTVINFLSTISGQSVI